MQEPWAYKEYVDIQERGQQPALGWIPPEDFPIYKAVHPICRYMIRMRYMLLQLLYDAMFENLGNGLPIARAMVSFRCMTSE